jgi:NAD(P)-dependent dehydrogenase (short-subunit alcohol dehydrogenase family)/ketosteroid isomerase-like protein
MRNTAGKNADAARELGGQANIDVTDIDVTDDASVKDAFARALSKYGHIDVLINNAAVSGFGLTEAFSLNQVRAMFEVNFYGVLRTYQAVLPAMRKQKDGLIINITSGASGHTLPFMVPYLASKFSVESITEGIQDELKEFGIENVSIQPGVYPTEMTTGVKTGVNADLEAVAAEYGPGATEQFEALGKALFGKMAEFKMDPQTIADGILELVNMKKGSRPLRFPLDAIAQGTDKEFIEARAAIKTKWAAAYAGVAPVTAGTLLRQYLEFMSKGEPDKAFELFAEDAVIELPYLASLGGPSHWEGSAVLRDFLRNLPLRFKGFHFKDIQIHIDTPDQAFGEYRAEAISAKTGQPYKQHYMGRVVAENGKIKLLREALDMSQISAPNH